MKRLTRPQLESLRRDASDPLEEAWESARDARDIIRDRQRRERRSLPEYTGDDEDTARHEVHVHVTNHAVAPSPSKPDGAIDTTTTVELHGVKVTGLPKWLVAGLLAGVAAATAFAAHLLAR